MLVVAAPSAPKTPTVADGIGIAVESTATTSMAAVLRVSVVVTAAMLELLWAAIAVAEDGGMVKDRRAAQVAGFSPCAVGGQMSLGDGMRTHIVTTVSSYWGAEIA